MPLVLVLSKLSECTGIIGLEKQVADSLQSQGGGKGQLTSTALLLNLVQSCRN